MLPKGYKLVLDWFKDVASTPGYKNPRFQRFDFGGSDSEDEDDEGEVDDTPWNAHEKLHPIKAGERIIEI